MIRTIKDSQIDQNFKDIVRENSNIKGEIVDITDTGVVADTEFSVSHGLKRVPSQVEILVKEGQTDAYLSIRPGSTAWTNTKVYLDCSSANAALRIRIT